jgi:hypothetical protein
LYRGSVGASSDDLITRLDDLTKILNLKPLAVTIVGTENGPEDDRFDGIDEFFHEKDQFNPEETVGKFSCLCETILMYLLKSVSISYFPGS